MNYICKSQNFACDCRASQPYELEDVQIRSRATQHDYRNEWFLFCKHVADFDGHSVRCRLSSSVSRQSFYFASALILPLKCTSLQTRTLNIDVGIA